MKNETRINRWEPNRKHRENIIYLFCVVSFHEFSSDLTSLSIDRSIFFVQTNSVHSIPDFVVCIVL
jgi:hypothetical protein